MLISLYFIVHAIVALRVERMHRAGETRAGAGIPGLSLIDDILVTGIDDYYELSQKAEIGQLDRGWRSRRTSWRARTRRRSTRCGASEGLM